MKRTLMLVCCLLLALAPLGAGASTAPEIITAEPAFYDPANDVPAWLLGVRNVDDALIQSYRGGTFIPSGLLPVEEDLLIWHGTFEYHDLVREEAHNMSYDRAMPRTDAYAVAVDGAGNRLWSLRLSDPQSENGFSSGWQLPDGRIMLKFNDFLGEWGTQYYIVSREGEVQEMLPAYRAREYGVYETLVPLTGGYFGGGVHEDEGGYGPMMEAMNLARFDADMNLLWQYDDPERLPASIYTVREAGESLLLGGGFWATYIPNNPSLDQPMLLTAMVVKLDADGQPLWTYTGHKHAVAIVADLVPTADGGAVFGTWADPEAPTGYSAPSAATLAKLDGAGQIEWVRQYLDDMGLADVASLLPYGDGYLLCGRLGDDPMGCAVLHVAGDGTPLARVDIALPQADGTYVYLTASPDGDVYAYGATVTRHSETVGMDEKPDYKPYQVNISALLP